jgi:hypothetical protein
MAGKIKRRDFLKGSVGTGAAALLTGGLGWPHTGTGIFMPAKAEYRCRRCQGRIIWRTLGRPLTLGGSSACPAAPGWPSAQHPKRPPGVTKPDIVRAVIRMCKKPGPAR